MKRVFLAGAALLLSASALADECDKATTQVELNTCSAQQYQAADKKLNQTYQAAVKRAEPPQRELLKRRSRPGLPCATRTVRLSVRGRKAAAFSR